MSKVIAVTNQKGGVGKTTTCVNLAASIAATKRRVLLIDLDPQGNATAGSGVDKLSLEKTVNELLLGEASLSEVICNTEVDYDVLPTNGNLTVAEVRMLQIPKREQVLKDVISPIRDQYDFIFIDCPPSLSMLTVNALVAADSMLIPMQCEYFALEGLTALLNTFRQLRNSVNPTLEIEGLLRTMYDGRSRLNQEVSTQLIEHFGDKVYSTVIPRNVRLAEAPSHGKPVLHYDKQCQGAMAYLALAGEMLRKEMK